MRKGFPPDIRQAIRRLTLYTGMVWQHDGEPGIILKLPSSLSFPLVPVSIDQLRRQSSSTFSLTVHLQQRGHPTIPVECQFSQRGPADTRVVQALLAVTQVEVYAVSQQLTFLGTQQLPWSNKKRRHLAQLAHDLLTPPVRKAPPEPLSSLHAAYQRTLHHLHEEELTALLAQEAAEPGRQWTTVPLVTSTHTFEEQVLAAAHQLEMTEAQVRLFVAGLDQNPVTQIAFPNFPFWIECQVPLPGAHRIIAGAMCFRATYEPRPLSQRKGGANYRVYDRQGPWRLDLVERQGRPLLRLLSSSPSLETMSWHLDPSHLCPTGV